MGIKEAHISPKLFHNSVVTLSFLDHDKREVDAPAALIILIIQIISRCIIGFQVLLKNKEPNATD